jgi:hypothetical protein
MPLATMIDRHRGGTASMAMRFFGPLLKEATVLRRGMVGRRGPGLLGTVARTAVVAGTATATANAVNNRQARRAQAAADEQAQRDAQQQPSGASMGASGGDDLTSKIKQLADLNAAGALTDDEFAAAKAKLLGT